MNNYDKVVCFKFCRNTETNHRVRNEIYHNLLHHHQSGASSIGYPCPSIQSGRWRPEGRYPGRDSISFFYTYLYVWPIHFVCLLMASDLPPTENKNCPAKHVIWVDVLGFLCDHVKAFLIIRRTIISKYRK